jgi:hypothetical protein
MRGRTGPRISLGALAGVGAAGLLVLAVALSGLVDYLLAAAGLGLLVLPGIALAITQRPIRSLRRLDLLVIGAAVSLAGVAIGGLILNLLPVGLGRASWLGLTAVLLIVIALAARDGLPPLRREAWVGPKPGQALAMVAAGALVVLALAIARVGVRQPAEPFSALWVGPPASAMVEIGLDNREGVPMSYRVEVTRAGVVTTTFPVTIASGERWTTLVPEPDPGGPRMEVLLFVDSEPDVVYRRVTLSVGPAAGTGT